MHFFEWREIMFEHKIFNIENLYILNGYTERKDLKTLCTYRSLHRVKIQITKQENCYETGVV